MMMMKYRYVICTLLAVLSLGSCDFETSDNGDFDGNWQLMRVDTLKTGGSADVKASQIFYAVQVRPINIRAYNYASHSGNFYFHFDRTGNTLTIKSAASNGEAMYSDEDVEPYGLSSVNEHFTIVTLTSDNMVLQSDKLRLQFRKF